MSRKTGAAPRAEDVCVSGFVTVNSDVVWYENRCHRVAPRAILTEGCKSGLAKSSPFKK
ncbi:MAG: hypothetical protein J5934_07025 [Succinivibrio sp.]|nr:hypothetical protein [Succinivibrio sp.]